MKKNSKGQKPQSGKAGINEKSKMAMTKYAGKDVASNKHNEKTRRLLPLLEHGYLLLICVVLRLLNAQVVQSYLVADEYWQSLEVAHNLVFGYGYLTWEWKYAVRSYAYIYFLTPAYYVLKYLNIDTPSFVVWAPTIYQSMLTAITDAVFVLFVRRTLPSTSNWIVFCYATMIYWNCCATRNLYNTVETNLTIIALHYYPLRPNSGKYNDSKSAYLIVVGLTCILRPTVLVIWLYLIYAALLCDRNRLKLFRTYFLYGVTGLLCCFAFDCLSYGRMTFTVWNFLRYNFVENISYWYGVLPFYWYWLCGLPMILGIHTPAFLCGVKAIVQKRKMLNRLYLHTLMTILVTVVVFSINDHKEERFLLPLVPFLAIICGLGTQNLFSGLTRKSTTVLLTSMLISSIFVLIFLGTLVRIGQVKVMHHLRNLPREDTILFLMPCHSTPLYSHLHMNITTCVLRCEPPLPGILEEAKNESDVAMSNPLQWFYMKYDHLSAFPNYIVTYDYTLEHIKELSDKYYKHLVPPVYNSPFRIGNAGHFIHILHLVS